MPQILFNKDCGLLAHPSSLPNRFGIGDFGPASIQWIEALAAHGQNTWQILPLNPAGYGDSPYQGLSAFAANPVFISPEDLHARGLIDEPELMALQLPLGERVDYAQVYSNKTELTTRAALNFFSLEAAHPLRIQYNTFCQTERNWLKAFALFSALKANFGGVAWTDWPSEYRDRDAAALESISIELKSDINRI